MTYCRTNSELTPAINAALNMTNSANSNAKRTLGLMAKHWTPGKVKTRLGRSIGMHRSAQIYRLFVQFLTLNLADSGTERQVVGTPTDQIALIAENLAKGWNVVRQSDGDLGNRKATWFRSVHSAHSDTILIGGDCPLISPVEISNAFDKLIDHEVVLGPAVDGGYYLVGIRGGCPEAATIMFDAMTWGHESVLQITRQRLELAEISSAELPPMQDVDTLMDLHALRQEITLRCEAPLQDENTAQTNGIDRTRLAELLTGIDTILVSDEPTDQP